MDTQADLDARSIARGDAVEVDVGPVCLRINPTIFKARKLLASIRKVGDPVGADAYAMTAIRLRDAWADFDRGDGPMPSDADAIEVGILAIRASYRDVTDEELDAASWFTTDNLWPIIRAAWGLGGKKKAAPCADS